MSVEPLIPFPLSNIRGELIGVDNGSTEGSATTAERCGARGLREARRGSGNALMRGIEEAQSPLSIMADADSSQTSPNSDGSSAS